MIKPRGPFRLGSVFNIYSSPVAAAGRIYVTDRNGKTLVMSNDAEPKAITLNKLDDRFSASAALVGDAMFLRGEKFLYCIDGKDWLPIDSCQIGILVEEINEGIDRLTQ